MALFNKKKEVKKEDLSPLPQLPRLPELPDLENEKPQTIHQLPSYPNNSIGTKFSHDAIKEAVSGEEEDDESFESSFLLDEDKKRMIQEPIRRPLHIEEVGTKNDKKVSRFDSHKSINEPVFIRIDKFEEALNIFNKSKKKISEIEQVLEEIKKIKEKEDRELQSWGNEIMSMKEQISKVDRDIFSKV